MVRYSTFIRVLFQPKSKLLRLTQVIFLRQPTHGLSASRQQQEKEQLNNPRSECGTGLL